MATFADDLMPPTESADTSAVEAPQTEYVPSDIPGFLNPKGDPSTYIRESDAGNPEGAPSTFTRDQALELFSKEEGISGANPEQLARAAENKKTAQARPAAQPPSFDYLGM